MKSIVVIVCACLSIVFPTSVMASKFQSYEQFLIDVRRCFIENTCSGSIASAKSYFEEKGKNLDSDLRLEMVTQATKLSSFNAADNMS